MRKGTGYGSLHGCGHSDHYAVGYGDYNGTGDGRGSGDGCGCASNKYYSHIIGVGSGAGSAYGVDTHGGIGSGAGKETVQIKTRLGVDDEKIRL